jgi:hypothetical protein
MAAAIGNAVERELRPFDAHRVVLAWPLAVDEPVEQAAHERDLSESQELRLLARKDVALLARGAVDGRLARWERAELRELAGVDGEALVIREIAWGRP